MDRILNFIYVDVNENLANQAWDKWAELKTNTKQSIKNAMNKKNKILMNIKPRKIIIPINRYDLKSSKWLQLDVGNILMETINLDDIYSNRYNITINNVNFSYFENVQKIKMNDHGFNIVSNLSAVLGFSLLSEEYSNKKYPSCKLFVDINMANIQITEYIYTLLMFVVEIFR